RGRYPPGAMPSSVEPAEWPCDVVSDLLSREANVIEHLVAQLSQLPSLGDRPLPLRNRNNKAKQIRSQDNAPTHDAGRDLEGERKREHLPQHRLRLCTRQNCASGRGAALPLRQRAVAVKLSIERSQLPPFVKTLHHWGSSVVSWRSRRRCP